MAKSHTSSLARLHWGFVYPYAHESDSAVGEQHLLGEITNDNPPYGALHRRETDDCTYLSQNFVSCLLHSL